MLLHANYHSFALEIALSSKLEHFKIITLIKTLLLCGIFIWLQLHIYIYKHGDLGNIYMRIIK